MQMISGLIGGLIGGVIGAAIWAGVSYATDYEIGWIAWAVGGLVGLGVAAGWKGGGVEAGTLAVLISVIAILAGKYAATYFIVLSELKADVLDEEFMIADIAVEVAVERAEKGEAIEWPEFDESGEGFEDIYPAEIWAEAQTRWTALSEPEKQRLRDEALQAETGVDDVIQHGTTVQVFKQSFGMLDIVFFGLAVVTAFQVAASRRTSEADVQVQQ